MSVCDQDVSAIHFGLTKTNLLQSANIRVSRSPSTSVPVMWSAGVRDSKRRVDIPWRPELVSVVSGPGEPVTFGECLGLGHSLPDLFLARGA